MLGVTTAAVPASLRRTNQRTVVSLLQQLGTASRADLAKAAGLSQPTAGKIITELERLGFLQQVGSPGDPDAGHGSDSAPRLGRPRQLVQLDSRQARFMAIELGVEHTRIAALPVAAKLNDEWAFAFPTPKSPDAWTQELKRVVAALPKHELWGILVSVPGIVDEGEDKVLLSPNLHWLEKADLTKTIGAVLDLPVVLVQEIRALALGHLAAEPDVQDFLLVDFGVGVGGAIVKAGKPYSSPLPMSGEIGHTLVQGNERRCGCGSVGCLETLVSERGLLESFARAHRISKPAWARLARHVDDHGIEPWLAQALVTTAIVISGTLNVLGLARVVLTGRLAELPKVALDLIAAEVRQAALWARFGDVVCLSAPRRRAAGLVITGIDRLVLPSNRKQGLILQSKET
jgi:predicted NBD/HSP70 family sugar kinase